MRNSRSHSHNAIIQAEFGVAVDTVSRQPDQQYSVGWTPTIRFTAALWGVTCLTTSNFDQYDPNCLTAYIALFAWRAILSYDRQARRRECVIRIRDQITVGSCRTELN
jgi:hypothetical protein